MGRYSYSQPSSSSASVDITSLLEAEGQLYADEAQSNGVLAGPVEYEPQHEPHQEPQPEADDGIPTICYCGLEPVLKTAHTEKDLGRLYFSCDNASDGYCHIWKWWDLAVMEELRDFQSQLRRLNEDCTESEQKRVLLEKTVHEIGKNGTQVKLLVCLLLIMVLVFLLIREIASKGSNQSVIPPYASF